MAELRRIASRSVMAVATALFLSSALPAAAEIGSDKPAAILVFPKILVDTDTPPNTPRGRVDTLIRISNTSDRPVSMKCFYLNANGHCRAAPGQVCDPYDLDAQNLCAADDPCIAGWQQTDFFVNLTAGQPTAWLASQGATPCELSPNPDVPCFPLGDNRENRVPPVPENPFIGYLKCIAVDRNEVPIERNVVIGDIQIVRSNTDDLDVEEFNAIGIPAIPGTNDFDKTLVIGGAPTCSGGERSGQSCQGGGDCPGGRCLVPEYESCPNILIMDHIFEGANDPISGETVNSILTFVPCSDDYEQHGPVLGVLQFLIFNEFEQRLSTSATITCFHEFRLPDINGRSEARSIFAAAVQGTLTGQTRIRGVVPLSGPGGSHVAGRVGHTWLAVVEELREGGSSAAFAVDFHGTRPEPDFIRLP